MFEEQGEFNPRGQHYHVEAMREKGRQGIGSIAGGAPPCTNCETEPVEDPTGKNGDALYCGPECRAEDEGEYENAT